ncbi:Serine/threonine protein phosphatase [Hyella patelloides LEGE 07179]|uniref:Serine/threonine protein phosphatase n=1 Tax=Hyella patelloides LEGE 07179 TaxID=945734 RepID=A0A563VIL2_9CYAN|nr:serine/threonine phosphatase [Hyella patelloides]VEP11233.1 Serine/threonine protein phosphatase [Hyella patelloides LEGE 07179]
MLICPECQSENPDSNRFCQHCGNSLVHTNCQHCGAEIFLIAEICDRCGTPNAKQLQAFIVSEGQATKQLELASNLVTPSKSERKNRETVHNSESSWEINQQYLDSQQRYYFSSESDRKLASKFPFASQASVVQTHVRDKFPLKKTYLDILKKQQEELFTELEQRLSNPDLSLAQYPNKIKAPTIALPYLMLENYAPVIPQIYDTWQDSNLGVLLISDRSDWQLLTTLWSDRDVPWEQILWSLNEMLKFWIPLVHTGCITTLLIEDNLRIDEDESFGFQQLYLDPKDNPPSLLDLAAKWHEWLSRCPEKYPLTLEKIIQKAIAEKITNIQELRQELYTLATSERDLIDYEDLEEEISDWLDDSDEKEDLFALEQNENEIDSLFDTSKDEDQPTAALRMEIASVTEASCTDIGSQRDHNEDFFGTKTIMTQEENPSHKTMSVRGLYIVCDGMGGHSAGEVASAMAVDTLTNYFYAYWQNELPEEETINEGILLTNRTIYQTNIDNQSSGHGMMGTTLVMALLQDTQLAIAHVGDSRIYRVTRTQGLEQLTQDHEVGQREINRGVEPEIAYGRPDAYQLTQALGPRENKYIKPSIELFDIEEDCLILLCSDGLCDNNLLEKHWKTYLKPLISSSADIQSGLFKLIDFADRYNGHDNITGILLRIKLQPNFET